MQLLRPYLPMGAKSSFGLIYRNRRKNFSLDAEQKSWKFLDRKNKRRFVLFLRAVQCPIGTWGLFNGFLLHSFCSLTFYPLALGNGDTASLEPTF